MEINKDFSRNVWCVLGLPFDAIDLTQCTDEIISAIAEKRRCFLSTPNLNFLCAAQTDTAFRQSVINSDLSIADGLPIVWIAQLLQIPLPERVAGSDLIERLFKRATNIPVKVYFFGGETGAGEIASQKINQSRSGLQSVGYYCPGFGTVNDMSTPEIIDEINAIPCDFLIVALGAKKGQAWIEHNRLLLNAPVISHLGAVINFFAGSVKRAPIYWQRLGFEWLWRVYQEPLLWQRYFNDGISFLGLLFTSVLPYRLWLALNKTSYDKIERVFVEKQSSIEGGISVSLSGRCYYEDIEPLRSIFSALVLKNKNIVIDLAKVDVIDGAFIGLILILYKHLAVSGSSLILINANDTVKRIIKWNRVSFLLG